MAMTPEVTKFVQWIESFVSLPEDFVRLWMTFAYSDRAYHPATPIPLDSIQKWCSFSPGEKQTVLLAMIPFLERIARTLALEIVPTESDAEA